MYLLIISIIALAVGVYLLKETYNDDLGVLIIIISAIILLAQASLMTSQYRAKVKMKEREAFRTTLSEARKNGSELENATILLRLAEWNEWTVKVKSDNEFWFDIYLPDAVDTMTLMK